MSTKSNTGKKYFTCAFSRKKGQVLLQRLLPIHNMRDGEQLPYALLPELIRGYEEVIQLPADYAQRIRFTSILINVRTLARSLQKRPPDSYTQHQLKVLHEALAALQR